MSQKPAVGYNAMQEDPGAEGSPPYDMQPGYPPAQPGCPQPVMTQLMGVQQTNTTVSTGLCECFEDCYSFCLRFSCLCCLLCDVPSRMGEGCCFAKCCPGALLGRRVKLRLQEQIQGCLRGDLCAVNLCGICVLCQLHS